MRPGRLCTALLLVAVHAAAGAGVARADDATPAKTEYDGLVDDALTEFDAGRFEEALSAFEQAYQVKPSARALRGIAKALFELRSYARCVQAIDRALASDVEPVTGALREDLESLKARALRFVGEAILEVSPPTATVVFDGEALDLSSGKAASRVVDVGTHTLEVSAPDHEPQRRRFETHGGAVTRVVVRLDPVRTITAPLPQETPPANAGSRTPPLLLVMGAVAASTAVVVGSSIWFVDRGVAVGRCDDAAAAGARCANADSVAFERSVATWTLALSAAAVVASSVLLVVVLRGERRPAPRTAVLAW
jgi:hypothetical protein